MGNGGFLMDKIRLDSKQGKTLQGYILKLIFQTHPSVWEIMISGDI